jgi:hypothetical protein
MGLHGLLHLEQQGVLESEMSQTNDSAPPKCNRQTALIPEMINRTLGRVRDSGKRNMENTEMEKGCNYSPAHFEPFEFSSRVFIF